MKRLKSLENKVFEVIQAPVVQIFLLGNPPDKSLFSG